MQACELVVGDVVDLLFVAVVEPARSGVSVVVAVGEVCSGDDNQCVSGKGVGSWNFSFYLPKPPLPHRMVLYGFGAERGSSCDEDSEAGRMWWTKSSCSCS